MKYQIISKKDEKNIHTFNTVEEVRDILATDKVSALTGLEIMHLSQGRSIETKVCRINVAK